MEAVDPLTEPRALRDALGGPDLQAALARLLLQTRSRSEELLPVVARRLQWDALARTGNADPAIVEVVETVLAREARVAAQRRPQRNTAARYIVVSVAGLVGLFFVLALAVALTAPRAPPAAGGAASPTSSIASEILPDRDGVLHPIALSDGGRTGDDGLDGRPSKLPTVSISDGNVRVGMPGPERGAVDLLCADEAGDGGLEGCRVVCATKPELGDAAMNFAGVVQFKVGAPLPSSSPIRVHVVWRDATTSQSRVDVLCATRPA
jgi:hypothetical protein